jgi:hypothetical protein
MERLLRPVQRNFGHIIQIDIDRLWRRRRAKSEGNGENYGETASAHFRNKRTQIRKNSIKN